MAGSLERKNRTAYPRIAEKTLLLIDPPSHSCKLNKAAFPPVATVFTVNTFSTAN